MGCGGSSPLEDCGDGDEGTGDDAEEVIAPKPPPLLDARRAVHAQTLSATASLEEATKQCEAAVEAVLSGLSEERYTDPIWSPLEGEAAEANMLFLDQASGGVDCSVGQPHRWARLSEVCEAPVLISNRIKATDVRQGDLGDCHLLSAIAAVASAKRSLLEALFVRYDIAKGVYGVRLFLSGAWTYVLVDDLIPLDDEGEKLYAHCDNVNEVWLPVLEKAIAKACCCFENLDGGKVPWALEVVTGGLADPREMVLVEHTDASESWHKAAAFLKRGDVVAASTYDDEDLVKMRFKYEGGRGMAGEGILACGLVGGHCYALLGVYEYNGTQLYKLRNPWGSGEWTGAWSDESADMDEAARAALGVVAEDDGIFFMSAADFSKYFVSLSPVRLWDASWSLTSTRGYFHRGVPRAIATDRNKGSLLDRDELTFQKGDEMVLTDMQSNIWWQGYKPSPSTKGWFGEKKTDYFVSTEKVELAPGTLPLLKFQLTAAEQTEAIVVLLQPDVKTRREYKYSSKHQVNEAKDAYARIGLMVKTADEEEEIASHLDTERKVIVTADLGPTPLIASIADYGGTGQKYELFVYSRSSVTITPLMGNVDADTNGDDEATEIFARYDRNGQGTLSRDEMAMALLEMGKLSTRGVDEQRKLVDEQFRLAVGDHGDEDELSTGVSLERFVAWYRAVHAYNF